MGLQVLAYLGFRLYRVLGGTSELLWWLPKSTLSHVADPVTTSAKATYSLHCRSFCWLNHFYTKDPTKVTPTWDLQWRL